MGSFAPPPRPAPPMGAREVTWRSLLAFTLMELLVTIGIIGLLAGLILGSIANAKTKALRVVCVSNMKQIGLGMNLFIDEHGQNLPGPCYQGVSRRYFTVTRDFIRFGGGREVGPTELIGYLAPYMGMSPAPPSPLRATGTVAVCPGFMAKAPQPAPDPRYEGYSYFCVKRFTNSPGNIVTNPFGYLDGNFTVTDKPMQLGAINDPSARWAIMDADKTSIGYGPWHTNLPRRKVHGSVWNRLYFDGHIGTAKRMNE